MGTDVVAVPRKITWVSADRVRIVDSEEGRVTLYRKRGRWYADIKLPGVKRHQVHLDEADPDAAAREAQRQFRQMQINVANGMPFTDVTIAAAADRWLKKLEQDKTPKE